MLVLTTIAAISCVNGLFAQCNNCTAGGPGSSQCSNSNCSVTCKANKYACCVNFTCICCNDSQIPASILEEAPFGREELQGIEGAATVSTSADGEWIFVTVASREAGRPLRAAFVVQFGDELPVSSRPHLSGAASLRMSTHLLVLGMREKGTWVFAAGRYIGPLPDDEARLIPITGIATYRVPGGTPSKPSDAAWTPKTHEEFVQSLSLKSCNSNAAEKQSSSSTPQ